jgi:hypothetical protein
LVEVEVGQYLVEVEGQYLVEVEVSECLVEVKSVSVW